MKPAFIKSTVLTLLISLTISSCVTLQQPLPGSLWGNWAFVQTGTIINGANQRLVNYKNVCAREMDRVHFSSDYKMSLRWYDESCMINHYSIGSYQVKGNTLQLDLADHRPYQDRPFPPIKKFRIIQITNTTLKLEEIPSNARRQRHQGKPSGPEALVYVFKRIE